MRVTEGGVVRGGRKNGRRKRCPSNHSRYPRSASTSGISAASAGVSQQFSCHSTASTVRLLSHTDRMSFSVLPPWVALCLGRGYLILPPAQSPIEAAGELLRQILTR